MEGRGGALAQISNLLSRVHNDEDVLQNLICFRDPLSIKLHSWGSREHIALLDLHGGGLAVSNTEVSDSSLVLAHF